MYKQTVSIFDAPTHQLPLSDSGSELDLYKLEREAVQREMFLGSHNVKAISLLQGIAGYADTLARKVELNPAITDRTKSQKLLKELQTLFDKFDFLESDFFTANF